MKLKGTKQKQKMYPGMKLRHIRVISNDDGLILITERNNNI